MTQPRKCGGLFRVSSSPPLSLWTAYLMVTINGMALQGFVFKKFSVRPFYECDISCERELTCQSYNYVVGENSCELNNRTKKARAEHFRSDPARVYLRRLSNRGMYKVIRKLVRFLFFLSFFFFFVFPFVFRFVLDSYSVHKHAKKKLTNIQPFRPHDWSIAHTSRKKVKL